MLGGTGERRGERSGRGERLGVKVGKKVLSTLGKMSSAKRPLAVMLNSSIAAYPKKAPAATKRCECKHRRVPDPSKYTDANAKYRGPCCKGTRHAGRGGLTKCICKEKVSWFTQCTFCGAKIPPKTEAERNLLRLKGEMGKTSAEALSIVRGAQVDGWRAVLD